MATDVSNAEVLLESVKVGLREIGIDVSDEMTAEDIRNKFEPRKPAPDDAVPDDMLSRTITGGSLDGKTVSISAIVLRAMARPLEIKHGMVSESGEVEATSGFLTDLTKQMNLEGYEVVPAVAVVLWQMAGEYFEQAQKKTS